MWMRKQHAFLRCASSTASCRIEEVRMRIVPRCTVTVRTWKQEGGAEEHCGTRVASGPKLEGKEKARRPAGARARGKTSKTIKSHQI